MWEDPRNHDGGRWLISLDKKQRNTELDTYWLEVVSIFIFKLNILSNILSHLLFQILCLIGEAFEEFSDDVCGAVVNIRPKADKLSVWTSDASNREGILKIGQKLKERLGITTKGSIVYEAHTDSMKKSGSVAKFRFTL